MTGLLFIIGCGTESTAAVNGPVVGASPKRNETRLSVTDVYGKRIELGKPATRIASLAPGFTEMLFAVGCGESIVVRDRWSTYPREARDIPWIDGHTPSPVRIAGFDVDLALMYFKDDQNSLALGKVGIATVLMDPKNMEQVFEDLIKVGRLCGKESAARQLAAGMREQRKQVEAAAAGKERPLVYVEIDGSDPARPWTAGPGSFVDELITSAGGRNVAGGLGSPFAQISAEAVIRSQPDLVLILPVLETDRETVLEELRTRPGWSTMEAVKKGRVITEIDKNLLTIPGPRLTRGLSLLHEAIHHGDRKVTP